MEPASPPRGRLTVFLGAAPGVGKTTAMLEEAATLADAGTDVVVAMVETHGRPGTEERLAGLERVPARHVAHRGTSFDELDVDAVLRRHPQAALVDELAHTNFPGSRHEKRWQDVEELLTAGIDVITNLNVSHLDSLNDTVETVTGIAHHETVPDRVVAAAERIDLVDASPEALRARLVEGEVLAAGDTTAALGGYFQAEQLSALRALAVGWLADHGSGPAADRPREGRQVVAALTGAPEGRHVVRRSAQLAAITGGQLIGVHVRQPSGLVESHPAWLEEQRRLLAELGGRYCEVAGVDVARAVLDVCHAEGAGHVVLAASRRTHRDELLHGSVTDRVLRSAGPVEVTVISAHHPPTGLARPARRGSTIRSRVPLPRRRRQVAWVLSVVAPLVLTAALLPVRSSVGVAGALFAALIAVVGVAAIGGIGPAAVAIVTGFLTADFFFTTPYYSLHVDELIDLVALVAFAVAGGVVGALVDILGRQGVQVARSGTEAEGLARLAAECLSDSRSMSNHAAATLRATFDLEAVALYRRSNDGWEPELVAGKRLPSVDEGPFAVEIADGLVLVMTADPDRDRDLSLLRSFVGALTDHRSGEQLARHASA